MSIDNAKKALDIAGHGLSALEAIGTLVDRYTSSKSSNHSETELASALVVLRTIEGIVDAVRDSLNGKVSVGDLEKEIAKLAADLKQYDTAIDAAIDAKPER